MNKGDARKGQRKREKGRFSPEKEKEECISLYKRRKLGKISIGKEDLPRKKEKKMDKKVYELINDQINKELFSAYCYYEIAQFYREKGLDGFASWFKKQAEEEIEHADKFAEYLADNDEHVVLVGIADPKLKLNDLKTPLEFQLGHEKYVTSLIHGILAAAREVKDYATESFLDWYVKEQMEEEKQSKELLDKYELYAGTGSGLHALNAELGGRK